MKYTVFIENLEVKAHIGITKEEQAVLQPLLISTYLELSSNAVSYTDSVHDTVDYCWVKTCIEDCIKKTKPNTLEYVGFIIGSTLLEENKLIHSLQLKITKPNAVPSCSCGIQLQLNR